MRKSSPVLSEKILVIGAMHNKAGEMPRYFFNARINDELMLDPEGQELRDPDQAWRVARAAILDLIGSETPSAGLLRSIMEVTDAHGEIVFEYPFSEALGG